MNNKIEIYKWEYDKENPYTFWNKYRVVDTLKITITTEIDINQISKLIGTHSSANIDNVLMKITIENNQGDIINHEIFESVIIDNDDISIVLGNHHSIENYLLDENYIDVTKY